MNYVIIVAGGKGLRMGSEVPKQFLRVAGKPVLMRTLETFRAFSAELGIILVLPKEQIEYWFQLCREEHFTVEHTVIEGGQTRFESSRNGLTAIPDDEEGLVAVHDGVRPFVPMDVISRCFSVARRSGAAIPVVPVTDSLRLVSDDGQSRSVLRSRYRAVQTPQVFGIRLLKEAYRQPWNEQFTDDATVVEAIGHGVEMVEGSRLNIKITTPLDMKLGEEIAAMRH